MTRRVRVLQVIPHLGTGGAEWLVFNLATALDPARFDVQVLSLYSPRASTVERRLAAAGIPVQFLDKELGIDPSMFWKIRRVLRESRPDIVHTHLAVLQYALPSLAFRRRPRVIHTIHNLADRELPLLGRWAHALSFRAGVAPIAIAQAVADSFARVYGREPFDVIPNGIPVDAYTTPQVGRAAWRERMAVPAAALVFVCVARLVPQKRIDRLIRAFARIHSTSDLVLLLVGEGPGRSEMEQLSRELGVSDRVRFLGVRDDVGDVLAASDAFVLASDYEGHPLSVMEAMSAGLPVVATDVGGVPELVSENVSGLLVPRGDDAALVRALLRVSEGPALRARLSRAAQRIARTSFDVRVMARRYEDVYDSVLSGAQPSQSPDLAEDANAAGERTEQARKLSSR